MRAHSSFRMPSKMAASGFPASALSSSLILGTGGARHVPGLCINFPLNTCHCINQHGMAWLQVFEQLLDIILMIRQVYSAQHIAQKPLPIEYSSTIKTAMRKLERTKKCMLKTQSNWRTRTSESSPTELTPFELMKRVTHSMHTVARHKETRLIDTGLAKCSLQPAFTAQRT